jgi:hypothetical protein
MFDDIILFSKTNNAVQEPNPSWTSQTTIHCAFKLDLGFGTKKEVWSYGNSVKLIQLADYLKKLRNWTIYSTDQDYNFEIKNNETNFRFEWTKNGTFGFKVSLKKESYNKSYLLLEKHFGRLQILEFCEVFFLTIIEILSSFTNNEVSTFIGEFIFDMNNSIEYEFKIGQRVRTILGQNVKTERVGTVISKSFHDKDKSTIFQIMVDGKKLDKRYYPTDLKSEE